MKTGTTKNIVLSKPIKMITKTSHSHKGRWKASNVWRIEKL